MVVEICERPEGYTWRPTVRDVVLYHLQSLDGVGEEPGNWMAGGGPRIFENLGEIIATQDDVLLGRGTYDYWVGFWPTSDIEPFATFINGTRKHVFTSRRLPRSGPTPPSSTAPRPIRRRAEAGRRRRHRHPREHRAVALAASSRPRGRAPAGCGARSGPHWAQALRRSGRGQPAGARAARQLPNGRGRPAAQVPLVGAPLPLTP